MVRIFWLSFLISVSLCWATETLLLELKYGLFSGGFLQPHSLTGFQDRAWFVALSWFSNVIVALVLALLWFSLGSIVRLGKAVAVYCYVWGLLTLSIGQSLIAFKVHAYFGDALTLAVMRNLGGGELSAALNYVLDEGAMIAYGVALSALAYYLGYRVVLWLPNLPQYAGTVPGVTSGAGRIGVMLALAAVVASGVVFSLLANRNDHVRHYLSKSASYQMLNQVVSRATDLDGDGFGALGYPIDPAPSDARIYPNALDIPNNGIDEDGVMGDFNPAEVRDNPAVFAERPIRHLVLVVIESGRADMLGYRVNGQEVTPVLNRLARDGTSVPAVYSHTGFTMGSLKAIFASRPYAGTPQTSLFTRLKQQGYEVSVFSGQDESFGGISDVTQMRQTAKVFFDASVAPQDRVFASADPGSIRLDARRVLKEINHRIETADWSTRQFFYINFQEPHFPYAHPGIPKLLPGVNLVKRSDITPENRQAVQHTYWNAVANVDAAIGKVLKALQHKGVIEDTLVVVTADHGESLFDNGMLGHGMSLDDVQMRIPLVVNRPGLDPGRAMGQVQMAPLLMTWLTSHPNRPVVYEREDVFQLTGSLSNPAQLGLIDPRGRRVRLDLRSQQVCFDACQSSQTLAEVVRMGAGEQYQLLRRLILTWEARRWEWALSKRQQQAALARERRDD